MTNSNYRESFLEPKMPKVAILDGDIIAYRAAFVAETEGEIPDLAKIITQSWIPPGVTTYYVAFSCPRKDNFRRAFWPGYKANRDDVKKPEDLQEVKEILLGLGNSVMMEFIEADDIAGLLCSSGEAIAVSIDKDFRQIPGWHWTPGQKTPPEYRSLHEANMWFYQQWITGDSTDNIWGLWRKGKKFAEKFLLEHQDDNIDAMIMDLYEQENWNIRPADKLPTVDKAAFALSQARCVRLLRANEYHLGIPTLWNPSL